MSDNFDPKIPMRPNEAIAPFYVAMRDNGGDHVEGWLQPTPDTVKSGIPAELRQPILLFQFHKIVMNSPELHEKIKQLVSRTMLMLATEVCGLHATRVIVQDQEKEKPKK